MQKWHQLEQVMLPENLEMTLHCRGDEYVIRVAGRELMSTRHYHSEEQLAVVACSHLYEKKNIRVLIGGLGLGFTLRAALRTLPPHAKVVVAELIPEVVAWNKNPDYPLASKALSDPRTEIVLGDVGDLIGAANASFDAIMLDADNETTAMHTAGNAKLYQAAGVANVISALQPGGKVVYWAASPEPKLEILLKKNGFKVESRRVKSHQTSGGFHYLIIGKLPGQ